MDRAKVLLVGLPVRMVFVQHVGRACLHLRLEDAEPKLLCLDRLAALALPLQACVQLLELLAPEIHEPLAALLVVGLVGAEECPVLVVLDPLHKEIRDPEPIEEIAGTLLLLTVVLAKLQEIENVRMPGLEVHSEGALPLASALIHIPRRLVEIAEHGYEAVAVAVGAANVGAAGTHVRDCHANSTGRLGDGSALLQSVVDTFDAVILQLQQKAGGHLWLRSPRIEEGRRRMGEELPRHQVIRLQCGVEVPHVDAAGRAHDHVLRPLHDFPMHT
mmetsp:Transcript_145641/g.206265  ORF Transcript_145641/g.206265 Transcript_145641/m.206265 type:complete len:274 (+) Transcript_145641:1212-2033(+)